MTKAWLLCSILLISVLPGCIDDKPEPVENTTVNQTPEATVTPAFPVPEPSTVYVEIKGFTFYPPELKVINGTTVRWTNLDSALHAVNGTGFRSPSLNKRETWTFTFNKTGIFEYHCSNHPSMPHGVVIVE